MQIRWLLLISITTLMAGCGIAAPGAQPIQSSAPAESASPAPTSRWQALLAQTPYPHTTPLPPDEIMPLDGLYARSDPDPPQWWACRRCADYRPAGGDWRLSFARGVMRIYYAVNGWKSLASYAVSGERLHLFNDPYCPVDTGEYTWKVEDGALVLTPIADACAFGLRAANLGKQPWQTCNPNQSGGLPRGCSDPPDLPAFEIPKDLPLRVAVRPVDARKIDPPLAAMADANFGNRLQPPSIALSASDASIPYGLHRILWKPGDWLQAATHEPYTAIGVQFSGDELIGWARLLFDGVEIWRGDTARIGSQAGQYGGYIEVSGFSPGEHTLRVERLDIDSRPVRVAFFGFR